MKRMIYLTTAFLSMLAIASTSLAKTTFIKNDDPSIVLTIDSPSSGNGLSTLQVFINGEEKISGKATEADGVYTMEKVEGEECNPLIVSTTNSRGVAKTAEVVVEDMIHNQRIACMDTIRSLGNYTESTK